MHAGGMGAFLSSTYGSNHFFRYYSVYHYLTISGVPFENGIALTRKNSGEGDWDAFAESWIP